ncbi:RagB/SusD family nutrient uptake outer membrane protein [Dyadobacter psychrotolerans]|uniref:RagB/SusD family nutrient uptake outer membrane protein n=1 Tax=Dyadobacter psychrotolerans TaxID=2541721 RepID=A0A4R5DVD1_9BACT|nr:RagB/SusD family nutrient uptake outer membrane protein [Dyadobacter psychrotolerans]TDE16494.1 RagB/SusD family nutrient uptake outer membrane protein [Dyadobacter psychrotolerans]
MSILFKQMSRIKISTVALALVMSVSSCSESFLEAVPELDLSDASVFETPARVLSQVNGLYGSVKNGNFLGGRYPIYNDIRGEEFVNRTTNSVTGFSVYQGNPDPADTYVAAFWNQGYLSINRVNLFLEGLAANTGKIDATLATNYGGEAKFIRALTYFSLVQIFAKPYALDNGASPGLPLRLKGETTAAGSVLARSTVAQIYDQILKDLNEAETALPDTYATPLLRTTRAHKNTAIALKTRVLLAKRDFAGVITEGAKIVSAAAPFKSPNRVAHELQADVVSVFRAPYTSVESIFSFPMADTNAPGTQNQIGFYFNFGNAEYFLNNSGAGILADKTWSATDDRRTKLTTLNATYGNLVTKFSNVSPFVDYVPSIRYAETLLNVAEAEAEAGSLTRARAILEAVRKRSDAAYQFGTLDKAGLIAAILTERRIELLAEGFRANDVLRRAQPLNSFGAGTLIQPTSANYVFGIPTTEQQTNPGL